MKKHSNPNNTIHQLLPLVLTCVGLLLLTGCQESQTPQKQEVVEQKEVKETESQQKQHKEAASASDGPASEPLEFTLTDLDGQAVKASDYRGKWLVINYWATWCAPCRDEMPELVKFQNEQADSVQVIGIAYEDASTEKLKNFAQDFNINYPLLTIDVYNPPAFAEEGGMGLPTTIVYNPEGMRHKKHMGPIDAAGLLEMTQ